MLTIKTALTIAISAPLLVAAPKSELRSGDALAIDPMIVGERISVEQKRAWRAFREQALSCPSCLDQPFPVAGD